jgi:hypothetical protein
VTRPKNQGNVVTGRAKVGFDARLDFFDGQRAGNVTGRIPFDPGAPRQLQIAAGAFEGINPVKQKPQKSRLIPAEGIPVSADELEGGLDSVVPAGDDGLASQLREIPPRWLERNGSHAVL